MRKAMFILMICSALLFSVMARADAESGTKALSVKAENDFNQPGYATRLAVYTNGAYRGTLYFMENDNSWTVESMQIPADATKVRLVFSFDWCGGCSSSNYSVDGGDLNAYIDWLEVNGIRIEAENFSRTGYNNYVHNDGTWAYPYGVDNIFYDTFAGSNVILMAHTPDWVEYDIPDIIPVLIDIKPGSEPNSINIDSRGVIPVAILSTAEFNAETVDPETVSFGPLEAWPENYSLEDIDFDGDLDMVFRFRTRDAGIAFDDIEAMLKGKTYDGMNIQGSDGVRVLESKGWKK